MKHAKLFLALLLLALICPSCQNEKTDVSTESDFIYLKDNKFQLHGEDFFPMMLNYVVSFQSDESEHFIIAPYIQYDSVDYVEAWGKDAVAEQLGGHFQLISELGFNTLRICFDRMGKDERGYFYKTDKRKFYINAEEDREAIFQGLEDVVQNARQHHLRIMLLIKAPMNDYQLEQFTISMLQRFSNEPTLFAYDFMNEPLYFDPVELRDKKDALRLVTGWKKMMTQHAPNQLFTIGFSEPIEVFEWDPSVMPVDFVEFHTYHPLRVPSEVYWYSHYVGKPWMIGETGLPADNDSISYIEQAEFMQQAYQLVRDAGGCGFGWWEFQEITNTHFEAQYTGLLNHEGRTTTADGKHVIYGSLKPAAAVVKELASYQPKAQSRPVNYYNMMGYKNICITGTILDMRTRKPIEGAVVRGWNEWWSVGMNTFTDENGHFTLYCNDECVHFEISAPHCNRLKFNKKISISSKNGKEVFNPNSLKNRELEYHQISFQPFLSIKETNNKSYNIFHFQEDEFFESQWQGDMGTILLIRE